MKPITVQALRNEDGDPVCFVGLSTEHRAEVAFEVAYIGLSKDQVIISTDALDYYDDRYIEVRRKVTFTRNEAEALRDALWCLLETGVPVSRPVPAASAPAPAPVPAGF